jgi:hypothetical protein
VNIGVGVNAGECDNSNAAETVPVGAKGGIELMLENLQCLKAADSVVYRDFVTVT